MGTRTRFLIVVAFATMVATTATVAFAAKGGGHKTSGSNGSVKLVMVNDTNGDRAPNYGESVTFTVSTNATSRPFVALDCYQNGERVYGFSAGIFPSYPWTQTYELSSDLWTGGAADCTATGYYYTSNGSNRVFGTLAFPVAA
jgi:hypothetical protein